MSRAKGDSAARRAIGHRFDLAVKAAGWDNRGLAARLNRSVMMINKVRRGDAFFDVGLLTEISGLRDTKGQRLNLNWLFSGKGKMFRRHADVDDSKVRAAIIEEVTHLPSEALEHLYALLLSCKK